MKPTPAGWPRMSASIYYDDAARAIDWLVAAFGFQVRMRAEEPDGTIAHSELTYGEALIMVGSTGRHDEGREAYQKLHISPKSVNGGNTSSLCFYIDDVDAHCSKARAAGAVINREPRTDDYGPEYWSDRTYGALDPEGHQWWFMQRIRDQKP